MALVVADILHDIKGHWMLHIERREVDDVVNAVRRHVLHNAVGGRAMRIDKGHTLTVADVLYGHIFEQGRLAHAGLADDVHVPRAILALNAERQLLAPRVRFGKVRDFIGVLDHRFKYSKAKGAGDASKQYCDA